MNAVYVLIPAYEPDERLVRLVHDLRGAAPDLGVLVVDDGSGPAYATVLDAARHAGAEVLTHDVNHGKGRALRTGFAHVLTHHPGQDVVSADCDGQHSVVDVLRVAARVAQEPDTVVLGARLFVDDVPLRSRVGNDLSRLLFRAVTGLHLQDTQTLRGYPATALPWLLDVPGDRFEYELEVLLRARTDGHRVVEVPIATIYLDGNASSHFRPLHDSVRVMAPLVRFTASSLAANAVDTVALLVLHALTGSLAASVVGARVLSASTNFLVNRHVVFRGGGRVALRTALTRYAGLALAMLGASYLLLAALVHVGVPLLAAKVATDLTLFVTSYGVQRSYVFVRHARDRDPAGHGLWLTRAG